MATNFSVDVPGDIELRFRQSFAGEALNEVMTALLKRAMFVRHVFDSAGPMLTALETATSNFRPCDYARPATRTSNFEPS